MATAAVLTAAVLTAAVLAVVVLAVAVLAVVVIAAAPGDLRRVAGTPLARVFKHQIQSVFASLVLSGGLIMPDAEAAVVQRTQVLQLLLENGFQAVWEEDHRQPLVAVEVRIQGGLRGEGAYAGTGITHFIEHMLFKGTPSRPPGTIEQEVRRYGGTINAFTSFDTTGVSLFVESRYLREALVMLADILQHAVFDQSEFEKELAVIISEIQMNLDDPNRRIHRLFWNRHFLEHPYRHPILGYRPLLEQLTAEDLASFYQRQYQPQRITLACVGDLDGAAFPVLVREVFGAWPRGRVDPSQQLVPLEPPTASTKEISIELPLQTAYAILGFSSTRLSHPDLYPLDVLANIIGQGRSSRLYETLVRKRRLADTIHAWNYTPFDPGIFAVQFRTDPEQVPEATAAVLEVLDEIKRQGVTEAELRKAKRQVIVDYHFARQTIESRATDLANSWVATGDPSFSQQYVNGIDQVRAKQVQEVAQRYCDQARMTTATIWPAGTSARATVKPGSEEGITVTKGTLDNGAIVLLGEDHRLPIATITVAFRGGVRIETEETQGLSNLASQMLTKGTRQRSASAMAEQVEGLGGSLDPFSGRDGFGLSLQLLGEDVSEGIELIHEVVTQSTFPEEELEIQRQLILKELKAQEDEIFDVGSRLFRRTLFTKHPYRFHPLGAAESLGRFSRSDCLEFSKRWMVPSNLVLSVFGDIDPAATMEQIQRSFGRMPSRESVWPAQLPADPLTDIREASGTLPKEQALIIMGFRGSRRTAPDRHALDVMTAVFSGMAGRLFQAVREKHGLSYTLGAAHVPGWDPGYFLIYAATKPEEQTRVLDALEEQLRVALEEGFTEEEVGQAKRYLIGEHRMDLQSLVSLARRSALEELYGLGFDAWKRYEAAISAVTVAAVHEVATRYLTLPRRVQVVISPDGHDTHTAR